MDPKELEAQGLDPKDFVTTGPVTRDTFVTYYQGKSTLSGVPAVLHWREGDIITLALVDDNGIEQPPLFQVPVKEIQSVTMMSTLLTLGVNGQKYKIDFKFVGRSRPQTTTLADGTQPNVSEPNLWWFGELKLHGVAVKRPKLLFYILIVLALLGLALFFLPKK